MPSSTIPESRETARDIAAAVTSGSRTAVDTVESALARIAEHEAEIHAFNLVTTETAIQRAREIDELGAAGHPVGALAGVPIAIKDNICTRGIPTTCSSRILEGWVPPYDATVIEKLHAAGAVIIGKTNMDEFAMGSSTENSAFGATRNPIDHGRVPGGSSGGSAAAVAAGFAPLALGSDTGGSIRQPASFCGVVGVKPTYGQVSRYGLVAFASSLDQIGPFASNLSDAALLHEVIAGHDPRDSTSIPKPAPSLSTAVGEGVEGMRIGVITELTGEGIDPEVRARIDAAIVALGAAGADVAEVSVPAVAYGISAYYVVAPAEASSNLARFDGVRFGLRVDAPTTAEMMVATRTAGFGDEVKRRIMLGTYALSAGYYDAYYGKALRVRTLMTREFEKAYETFDVLLSPTCPTTAFAIGERIADPLSMYLADVCTVASNLVGQPALSMPYGTDESGFPVGIQFLGPALGEAAIYRAAGVLEAGGVS